MNNKHIKLVRELINEMKEFRSSPHYQADIFHHETVHNDIHVPISKEIKSLGFFATTPVHRKGFAEYQIKNSVRGSDILTNQLGIGKNLIPIPQHHPKQEFSVRHLVDRAFSKKPSKYLKYLRVVHDSINNAIENHRKEWVKAHSTANNAIKSMKTITMQSLSGSKPIGSVAEEQQALAHHHAELASEHEKKIRELEHHKRTIVSHAHALSGIYGVDASDKATGDLNSPKIVGGIWDESL